MRVCGLGCAVVLALVLVLMSSMASAATIQEVQAIAFNPTNQDFYALGYGHAGYLLTWSGSLGADNHFGAGGPTSGFTYGPTTGNPAWLNFQAYTGSSSGGGGGGSTTKDYSTLYTVASHNHGNWVMDFSVLLYDPGFTGTEVKLQIVGNLAGTDDKTFTETAAEVQAGRLITYHLTGGDDETVSLLVTGVGGITYPAGFFMDNASGAAVSDTTTTVVPEPMSITLFGLGVVSTLMARARRRR